RVAENLSKVADSLHSRVQEGAALKTTFIQITPLRVRSNGKETSVSKASTAQKIKVAFTINPNALAETGMHDVYMRIIDPAGNLIIGEGGLFTANKQEYQYTYKTAIEFSGEAKTYTIDWANRAPFESGTYTVILYSGGGTMGRGTFSLK
ncbi:hypothetical protein EIM50_25395, partial [Pseudoxanthomonas sp. SGD-10]